jgi:hypothetical protein
MEDNMNKRIANIVVLALLVAGTWGGVIAQTKEEPPDRAVVPLTDPSKPAKIEVSIMRGSITVKGYPGREIVVEARVREKALSGYLGGQYTTGGYAGGPWAVLAPPAPPATPAPATAPAPVRTTGKLSESQQKEMEARLAAVLADQEVLAKKVTGQQYAKATAIYDEYFQDDKKRREEKAKKTAGMKQLGGMTSGLEIEEDDNVVQISAQSWKAATDIVIQVPVSSSLEVRTSMDGTIVVEGVNGEIDINNINGPVTLKNVSGNTLVHTVNGDIEAVMTRIAADKPLSFSTMHGDIDVTLPADVKANLKMKTEQGEIYTDFDMSVGRKATRAEATEKTEQGKFHITFDKSLLGQVNGGGAEISFNTFTGDIYIRKKK